ncbi:hypothetical protein LIER_23687 [Lithospermum erythrorhizon]|uniref:Reverse transcriptase zinc-binding domain-containing protein n=1 Tax=Lithospermum erythrorhizon TaxID=34254 RepID=A0AAV3R143_LITER
MTKFFWANGDGDKGIYWMAWDKVFEDKVDGLGFKDLEWRYFRRSPFLNAKLGANPSYGWRSLLEGRKVLSKEVRWQVGDGRSINMWTEPWVSRQNDFKIRGVQDVGVQMVSHLIMGGSWDRVRVEELFGREDTLKVLSIPLSRLGVYLRCSEYKCAREMKRNGDLRGSARGEGSTGSTADPGWKFLWGMKIPPRVKSFIWKCLNNILPMKDPT